MKQDEKLPNNAINSFEADGETYTVTSKEGTEITDEEFAEMSKLQLDAYGEADAMSEASIKELTDRAGGSVVFLVRDSNNQLAHMNMAVTTTVKGATGAATTAHLRGAATSAESRGKTLLMKTLPLILDRLPDRMVDAYRNKSGNDIDEDVLRQLEELIIQLDMSEDLSALRAQILEHAISEHGYVPNTEAISDLIVPNDVVLVKGTGDEVEVQYQARKPMDIQVEVDDEVVQVEAQHMNYINYGGTVGDAGSVLAQVKSVLVGEGDLAVDLDTMVAIKVFNANGEVITRCAPRIREILVDNGLLGEQIDETAVPSSFVYLQYKPS